jgi:TRAP transporter TAXI family solute receptor
MKKRGFILLLAFMLLLTAAVGCSQQTAPKQEETKPQEEKVEPMTLVAGSASSGGANYLLMAGWAELINNNTQHRVIVEATGGPASNIELMGNGDAQIGVVAMSVAIPAYKGTGWAKGKDFSSIRCMFGVHDAFMDGVTLEGKGINSIHDLNGKTVSLGPAGGTPALAVPDICDYFGVTPNYVNLGQGDSINALKDGQIDAAIFFGGVPRPAYQELAASHPVIQLALTDDEVREVVEKLPQYSIGTIKAGTYSYITKDVLAIKDRYAYAVDKDVPEPVVYELVKTTLDLMDEFKKVHNSLEAMEVSDMLLTGVALPLHPGAVRALKEAGINVPDNLLPPEM